MNPHPGLEKCLSFINCHLQAPLPLPDQEEGLAFRTVTISRQTGSGGYAVAEKLAASLQTTTGPTGRPWLVFDRNLVEKVLADHNLPARLARFMPEDRISYIADTMDELFGLHPPSWMLVRQTSETILHLAELGHVILIGRGANLITARRRDVFHVRLVGSLEQRVQRLQQARGLSERAALHFAEREDLARSRYVRQFFDRDINDPGLYHLILNTDLLSPEEAARMIATTVMPPAPALA